MVRLLCRCLGAREKGLRPDQETVKSMCEASDWVVDQWTDMNLGLSEEQTGYLARGLQSV
jgi:hypothetical protein